jgi:SPW repeat
MKRSAPLGDAINLILAVWLFLSPWIVGFAGVTAAAWTAWLSAIAIAAFAIAALAVSAEWEEWINLILGIWVLISPWVVGVGTQSNPAITLFFTGLVVAAIAAIELWIMHRIPPRMTTA